MTKVTISEAIRMVCVSRSHFYKNYINTGFISIQIENNKKLIDVSELIRVFGNIQSENTNKEHNRTIEDTNNTADKDKIIEILENQIQEAKNREEWLQKQIDELRQQQNNLLDDKTIKRKKIFGLF